MALVTKGRTFVSGEVVTPTKLNTLVDSATVTQIQTADISDAQITLAKLVATVQQALMPVGAVQAFAMNAAPTGWLAADGGEYTKTGTYAALFAAIGVTYGETNGSSGAGTTHFRVPDLRGYFVRGAGTNSDGTAAGTFGAKQSDDFKSHTHTATVTDPGHTHGSNAVRTPTGSGLAGGTQNASVAASIFGNTTGITVANASTGGTETRPANIAMLYCIKF
jgi:microcystin-dependent protein